VVYDRNDTHRASGMGDPVTGGLVFFGLVYVWLTFGAAVFSDQRVGALAKRIAMQRKQFLIGAGLGLVASALAACTTHAKKPEATSSAPATGGTAATAGALVKTADVPVGAGVIVGEVVVTQPSAGDFEGFSSTCTHAGCTLIQVADGTINCPCHGSKFNLDGSVANGPATKPLQAKAAVVKGDSIVLG
jgi:Rieske Fe-S protein